MNVKNNNLTPVPIDVMLAPIALVVFGLVLVFTLS